MKMKKVLALLLAGTMTFGSFGMSVYAEETEGGATEASTEAAEEAAEEAATEAAEEASTEAEASSEDGDVPMVVACEDLSQKFDYIFSESQADQDIASLVGVGLLNSDRTGAIIYNGIEGETHSYNGTDYTYYGIADCTVTENEDTTVYNFKLRDDIYFSDGVQLTADDVIFSLYVYCDPDYDGNSTLYSQDIVGLQNYRLGSTAASSITDEDVAAAIEEMPDELAASVKELITALLDSEYDWADGAWEDYAEDYGVSSGAEFFALFYSTDEEYSTEGKDRETIVSEIADMYGTDYVALATAYGDETYFDADVTTAAQEYLVAQKTAAGEGEEVTRIEGIRKLGDFEVEVTTNGFDATTIYQLGIVVSPMHYCGDESLYDYDNDMFGFTKGDLSSIREKSGEPLGAGAYKFVKYENKTVYLEANENYFLGAPKTKSVQFRESDNADMIPGVAQGTVDIANPSGSKSAFEQIRSLNDNGELDGDTLMTNLVDNMGYGYIGMNANLVSVGGDAGSDASKNLRKAIATVLAVYRDVAVNSYYGDAASVINYPISSTSWAAPQKSDADYETAYSTDVDGNAIYTDGMTDEEKFAAALQASLAYFEAAGYTVEDGVLTAAPEGAKLSYEVVIPADGTGDHPTFAILTDAKEALASIGFDLEINDITDGNILWDGLDAGTIEIWAAAWQTTVDPDMYQLYHSESTSSNYYKIADETLDADIMDARSTSDQEYRKSVYKECLDIILDWAVEIPVYQRQNCIIYSSERVDVDTFTPDVTTFYYWYYEIENIAMVSSAVQ